jgi:hypothetical protein
VVVRSLPVEIEQVIYAGTDFFRQYRWLPDGVTPQDFTSWTANWLIGPNTGVATYQYTTTTGEVGLSATGIITLHLDDTITDAMTGSALIYTLDLVDPVTSYVLRFMRGRVTIVRDLSPPVPSP